MTSAAGLAELARECAVAGGYRDAAGRHVEASEDSLRAVLGALGVDVSTDAQLRSSLAALRDRRVAELVPPTVVATAGRPLPVTARTGAHATIALEGGGERRVAAAPTGLVLPGDVPLGYHRLHVQAGGRTQDAALVVAPHRLRLPPRLGRQTWGWQVQLYATRSAASWGVGDYADLAALVDWSGRQGAGVLLANPLHAVAPVVPLEPSPYFPTSRRFRSPLYLRLAATQEYARAPAELRAAVDGLRPDADGDRIDRDRVWRAKLAALDLLWPLARTGRRADRVTAFVQQQGRDLADFALFCALAERHGTPWQDWPGDLHAVDGRGAEAARRQLADRVAFFGWLQLLCDEQLEVAAEAARSAGMPVGVVHDLAVGVDPGGADAWALRHVLAAGASVGAPPDAFNQQGQDWGLPPWHPGRLAAVGYVPFRELVRGVLRHAGGIRVDHVLGLFRLWWVPDGESPRHGAYVSYDDQALLGVLLLEAHRAGAVVIGEDLGTVAPRVRSTLADRGVLGSSVLYFERARDPGTGQDRGPLPAAQWRELAAASVSTHDLPTAAGFLSGEHVAVREKLGLLDRPPAEEAALAREEVETLVGALRAAGLVGPAPAEAEVIEAMYAYLVRTPCRLVLASLGDAIGDRRQPNVPGTVDQYPNWRLPLARPTAVGAQPVTIEEVRTDPRVAGVVAVLAGGGGLPSSPAAIPAPAHPTSPRTS